MLRSFICLFKLVNVNDSCVVNVFLLIFFFLDKIRILCFIVCICFLIVIRFEEVKVLGMIILLDLCVRVINFKS